jgi:hypothetical protein
MQRHEPSCSISTNNCDMRHEGLRRNVLELSLDGNKSGVTTKKMSDPYEELDINFHSRRAEVRTHAG